MTRRWAHPEADITVVHRDTTPFGGPIGPRIEERLRDVFATTLALLESGVEGSDPRVLASLADGVTSPGFRALATVDGAGSWQVIDEVQRPDPELTVAAALELHCPGGEVLDVTVPETHWPALHDLLAAAHHPSGLTLGELDPGSDMGSLAHALDQHGYLTERPPTAPAAEVLDPGITFLGHNAAVVRGTTGAVLIDPYLRPQSGRYPAGYQPLVRHELGPIDAVLITHGHPDHVDPGSLLRLPVDTPLLVPQVEQETLLAQDVATRLTRLGFSDVRPVPWGSRHHFGDVVVDVLPFYGEQATDGRRRHPEVVNAGNTYVIATDAQRAAFIADGGRDDRGSMADVAGAHVAAHGPIDVLFAGYRGWRTTPAELLRSSVGRYFLFVPRERWPDRMALMNDAEGALATATAFGASTLVPYADGGAPWFWELGLGPRLDERPAEREGFDPFPERVGLMAAQLGSAVDVLVLRPGEVLRADGSVASIDGHRFPWPSIPTSALR